MKLKIIILIISIQSIFLTVKTNSQRYTDELAILEHLVSVVLCQARAILYENPRFNNRDLICEFFLRNPHLKASAQTDECIDFKSSNPKKIAILGAGPSGLIAALALAQAGNRVFVYEKRSKEHFAQRWQIVSLNVPHLIQNEFPALDTFLKEQGLVQYEMELDDPTKLRSYRIAIGDFQNALLHLCKNLGVTIIYEKKAIQVSEIHDVDIIILSTGANSLERPENVELKEKFIFQSFPEYKTSGVAALYYEPETELPQGLIKERISGENVNWGFKVALVGNGVATQVERLVTIKPTEIKFSSIPKNPAIYWYLFATKNNSSQLPFSDPVDVVSSIDFIPAYALNGVVSYYGKPIILWGDARTSPHPLTGSALTIPFLSLNALLQFVRNVYTDSSSFEKYNQQTAPLAQELFIKTLLVTIV